MAVAATAMRRILVDHARSKATAKRGGGRQRITLHERGIPGPDTELDILDIHEAIEELSRVDARKARVIELRFFTGLTVEETAEVLEVSRMTVSEDWRFARAWLAHRLEGGS